MELTVVERLILMSLLPVEGTFVNLKLVRKAREELSFDEKENKVLEFVQDGGNVRWNAEANIIKDVDLGEVVTSLAGDALKKLDTDGALKDELLTLYEKFCT